jgi:prolyl oligopeptidase
MCSVTLPPHSAVEPVTETFHGIPVTDPYRWLEEQDSARTRAWISEQATYARTCLDRIPTRDQIRQRIREFLAVETYDSPQRIANRFFFRKRLPDQEQPCVYMREGAKGQDHLLIDPAARGAGPAAAVKPLRVSPDGKLLLYEVKQGGERTGTFEFLEIETRKRLPDFLPRGYLRGFAFRSNGNGFYYVHEPLQKPSCLHNAAYEHTFGAPSDKDRAVFFTDEGEKTRLSLFPGGKYLFIFATRFLEKTLSDIYIKSLEGDDPPESMFRGMDYSLGLRVLGDRFFAITDRAAPNRRIVEIRFQANGEQKWVDIVPEADTPISNWFVAGDQILVSYLKTFTQRILIFGLNGQRRGTVSVRADETARIVSASPESDEILIETQSFLEPITIFRHSVRNNTRKLWVRHNIPFDSVNYRHSQISYPSKDGIHIPMYLVGRKDIFHADNNPVVMTAYGGFGLSMTPQFSIFVSFLLERGCLFALPNIRGGSEFGLEWHNAAKRRNRQTAYDDFLCAAEWLINTGKTSPAKLAIFGGSNSGLLVGAALTQRPDLFRAAICMVPMLDMLRYHLFDNAHIWKDEFGTADDPADFAVLAEYSPYHRVRPGVAYPATMFVSGDADQNCNPMHARKMTARLQAASTSGLPILLDYSQSRGHSPVLPLSVRINSLTDRLAFLCDQLHLSV